MICFHDASLHKGRTKTNLIERDFPHHVEMIGRSLEFNLLRLGRSRSCPLWIISGHFCMSSRCYCGRARRFAERVCPAALAT